MQNKSASDEQEIVMQKCPVCRRTSRDMVPHLMQHVGSFEEDDCGCSLPLHGASDSAANDTGLQVARIAAS